MRHGETKASVDAKVQKAVEKWKSEPATEKPTPVELGVRFGLSHVTVRRALRDAGLIPGGKKRGER